MATEETNIMKRCMLHMSRLNPFSRLWRNQVGSGYTGQGFTMKPGQQYTARGGERLITQPRYIEFGLCKGSGDTVGMYPRRIMPADVPAEGLFIAQFMSVEYKTKTGRASKEQIDFRDMIQAAGGIAMIVNDPDQIEIELPR